LVGEIMVKAPWRVKPNRTRIKFTSDAHNYRLEPLQVFCRTKEPKAPQNQLSRKQVTKLCIPKLFPQ